MLQQTPPSVHSQTGQTAGRLASVQFRPCDRCGSVRFLVRRWHGLLLSPVQCALCGKVRR